MKHGKHHSGKGTKVGGYESMPSTTKGSKRRGRARGMGEARRGGRFTSS